MGNTMCESDKDVHKKSPAAIALSAMTSTMSESEHNREEEERSLALRMSTVVRAELEATYWLSHSEEAKTAQFLQGIAKLRRITLGSLHPATLNSLFALAIHLLQQGEYIVCEKMLRSIRSLFRKVHGATHVLTLKTVHALGLVAKRQNRLVDAEYLLRQAYRDMLSLPDSPQHKLQIGEIAYSLGIIYVQYGYRSRAVTYFQTTHDIFNAILGPADQLAIHSSECELLCIDSQLQQSLFPLQYTTPEGRFRSKKTWKLRSYCYLCKDNFGFCFPRRHHCRVCGESVCANCSNHRTIMYEYGPTEQSRICSNCFAKGF